MTPRGPTDTELALRPIDRQNYPEILGLSVKPEQQRYVATNAQSLAQALFHEEAWFRGIYAGDTPVGFVMLEVRPEAHEYAVWRLMIDASHQGKGYGRLAMARIVEHVRGLPGAKELLLSYVPGDGEPGGFYEKLGFEYTGEVDGGEKVMRLDLGGAP